MGESYDKVFGETADPPDYDFITQVLSTEFKYYADITGPDYYKNVNYAGYLKLAQTKTIDVKHTDVVNNTIKCAENMAKYFQMPTSTESEVYSKANMLIFVK